MPDVLAGIEVLHLGLVFEAARLNQTNLDARAHQLSCEGDPRGTCADDARVVLDRLRDAVGRGGFEAIAPQLKVSFSAGVAEVLEGETQDAAIDRADRALYRAKQAGRNRVEVAAGVA